MKPTIQDVIDTILQAVPGAPLDDTVDTYKSGDPSQEVTGMVTTFLASYEVIERAIQLGANLIITHEPTYYNHLDEVDWLEEDPVYRAKRKLLDDNRVVVWRFHDYWHRHRPDGILTGMVNALNWEDKAIVDVVGDLDMSCTRVGALLGAVSGKWQIGLLLREDVDVLVCGEINEWETSEYVRDAVAEGRKKALIILGHANSEEPGMRWLVEWLEPKFPGVAITHVPVGDPFHFL
jgi:putative NIF3 family GTP cyclohydrolase 1 type 2